MTILIKKGGYYMKIHILDVFLRQRTLYGFKINQLKEILEGQKRSQGPVYLGDKTTLNCVKAYYKIPGSKCSNCHNIHKHFNVKGVPYNACAHCHLEFVELYEQGKIQTKK